MNLFKHQAPTVVAKVLRDLEEEHGIRIMHAVECGSRAWGYSSAASDIDIRFVYVQLPWAKPLESALDTIRHQCSAAAAGQSFELDLLGFELRKCVQKTTASDMTLIEVLHSQFIWGSRHEFQGILDLAPLYINKCTLFRASRDQAKRHLYLNTVNRNNDKVTAKSMLLAFRFMMVCEALARHDTVEFRVDQLFDLVSDANPWMPPAFDWLMNNRDMSEDRLLGDPRSLQVLNHFKVVDRMHVPEGKRNRDLFAANSAYSKACQGMLATYHVTNSDDLGGASCTW